VTDREIDEVLKKAAQAPHEVDPALLQGIANGIKSSLLPVRPLPSTWMLTAGLVLICAGVALAGAARAGFYGFEKMNLLERGLIFPLLAILACVAGVKFVNEMIPGSRRWISPGVLLLISSAVLLGLFASLFADYHTDHFLSAGLVCLATGLAHAIPAALLSWLVLRRGFAVNSVSAGLAAGTLGGVAGVGMLELHCPNFQATHILVWHTAVLLFAGGVGALVGWLLPFHAGSSRS
jgi:Negative regulator of sigma F